MTILLLDPYFKIKGWKYRGILEVLVKNSLNLISFPLILPNFRGNENLRFWWNREEWVFPLTHFIFSHLKSQTREKKNILKLIFFHSFPFHYFLSYPFYFFPLKFPNKGMKEYSKIILFIHFYSILFSPPKRGLKEKGQTW